MLLYYVNQNVEQFDGSPILKSILEKNDTF